MKKKNDDELIMQELLEGYLDDVSELPAEDFFGKGELEHEEDPFEHEDGKAEDKKDPKLKAVLDFAEAIGEKPEEIADIFIKGMEYDELFEKLEHAKEDGKIFEKLAVLRGISPEEMKNEILWALEKATTEKLIEEILAENPGMNRETARELANFRLGMNKEKKGEDEGDKSEEMLFELEKFLAAHANENILNLDNRVVAEWEGGIPLETAFEKFRLLAEKEELLKEIEELRAENIKKAQKDYAKEFGPGSATSAAGVTGPDDFAAELFKEY